MKQLSKTESEQKSKIADQLRKCETELSIKIAAFNNNIEGLFDAVVGAQNELNEAINEANEFLADIHSAQEEFVSERSEKWAETEPGERYAAWMELFGESFGEVELDAPPNIDEPDLDFGDRLDDLSESPE